MESWRLIIHPPYPGAWNMAVDEAILESTISGETSATLRLYDWQPYTLSLGIAQSFSDVDKKALGSRGWDIVRRPTGGKAILHADELTYSICAQSNNPLVSGNVLESYRKLSTGLLQGLQIAGIDVDSKPKDKTLSASSVNPVCFQFPSDYEITYHGKKLIGSAQARRGLGILQHGALPLNGDITRIVEVLVFPREIDRQLAKENLRQRAITLSEIVQKPVNWQETADVIIKGFSESLDIALVPDKLSSAELKRAYTLFREKYNNPQWTERI